MRVRLSCAGLAVFLAFAPVRANFAGGLAAYDSGHCRSAADAWRPLAEAGGAEAQIALAGLYAGGYGVRQDLGAAVRLYVQATRHGHPVGQRNAGDDYARGWGVRRDPVTADMWLSLAAAQGRVWAATRRDGIARDMRPDQIAEAEAQSPRGAPPRTRRAARHGV